jgi:thymidylate synthase
MHLIIGESFDEVYKKAAEEILAHGVEVAPRGSKTLELSPATIVITNPRKFLTVPTGRRGNHTFQLAEALWMLRGSNNLDEIAHYNANWRNFEDEDEPGILNGAYGERLRNWNGEIDQFFEVYKKLKNDPFSRQASMVIFDPDRDNYIHENGNYSKDIPCTNYFNFTVREGKLNMYVAMRSNDLHKGAIYDIPNFIMFQHVIAGWLGIDVGKYTHTAVSLHIYESDIEYFKNLIKSDFKTYEDIDYGSPLVSLDGFNGLMSKIALLEHASRTYKKAQIDALLDVFMISIENIENSWWRSVIALIVMYNYRKLGANEGEFKAFLPYITNEYRSYALQLKTIGGK